MTEACFMALTKNRSFLQAKVYRNPKKRSR